LLFAAPALPAAQVAQTPVPDNQLANAPYKYVGLVSTGFEGPDPAYRGTGFVVGERVVLSAAHVFYAPERPGWNRASWHWQSAPTPFAFGNPTETISPRAARVLAGYSAAVARTSNPTTQLDELNRDTIALIFYRAVSQSGAAPIAYDSITGADTFSAVGYPAEIGGTTTLYGSMYGNGAGFTTTFTHQGPTTDYVGNAMALYTTPDLLSGGGQSGGPIFRLVSGTWKAVGVTIARAQDYSSVVVRALDSDAHTLIDTSLGDTLAGVVGQITRTFPNTATSIAPIFRSDGSFVSWDGQYLRAFGPDGSELWQRPELLGFVATQIAETPDGRIIAINYALGIVNAYEGASGKQLWQIKPDSTAKNFAIGKRGEIYLYGSHQLTCVSPQGTVEWVLGGLSGVAGTGEPAPVIGANGRIYLFAAGKLTAISPAGAIVWEQADVAPTNGAAASQNSTVAAGPEGQIYVHTRLEIRAFAVDGSIVWKRPEPESVYHSTGFDVLPDGRLVTLTGSPSQEIVVLRADGTEVRRTPVPIDSTSLVVGSDDTVYVTGSNSVQAYPADGGPGWINSEVHGGLILGPANLLYVKSGSPSVFAAITVTAGAATGFLQNGSAADQARRSPRAPDVAPLVIISPGNTSVTPGYRLALTVVADGSFPLTYEWRHNGVIVPEAFGSTLVVPAAETTDAGSYTVTVRNSVGFATSSAATVTVAQPSFGSALWSTVRNTLGTPAIGSDGTAYAMLAPTASGDPMSLAAYDRSGNQLWQTPLGPAASRSYLPNCPVIGDDGTVFIAGHSKVWAVSPAGSVRWSKDIAAQTSADIPYLALGVGNVLYVGLDMRLTRFRADGTQDWSVNYTNFVGSTGWTPQPRVRRDGSVLLQPRVLASPSGVFSTISAPTATNVEIIGPYDEAVCYGNPRGFEIFDAASRLVSSNTDRLLTPPVILNSEGNLVAQERSSLIPFYGSIRNDLPIPISDAKIMADLGEGRMLVVNYNNLTVVSRTGTSLLSAPIQPESNYVLGPTGVAVGGAQLRAYNVGISPSRSPWPMPGADARHTWRAPADFDWATREARSVTVTTSSALYAGYAATFGSQIDGVGPFTFQWQRNGVDLPGATTSQLTLSNPSTADSGDYRVVITNAGGSTYSPNFPANFAAPDPIPPGFYAGIVRWSNGDLYTRYAMQVNSDRTADLIMTGPFLALTNRSRFKATGEFSLYTNSSDSSFVTFNAGQLQFPNSNLTTTPVPISSTTSSSGLPVGFYRGGSAAGRRAYAAILPDGRVWWTLNGGGSGESTFPAGLLSANATASINGTNVTYQITGTTDGAVRVARSDVTIAPQFTPFSVVWSGRPSSETMVNLSTRGWVSPAWPPMIAGLVVQGPRGMLLRGAGPALAAQGVAPANVLAQPRLFLIGAGGVQLAQATRWSGSSAEGLLRSTAAQVGAFPFAEGSNDAALTQSSPGGLYSLLIDGADGGEGIALAEVYDTTTSTSNGRVVNLSTRGYAGVGDRVLIGGFVLLGSAPKTLLVRAIGSGLAPLIGQATFKLATYPRVQVYNSSGVVIASNVRWRSSDEVFVSDTNAQVGAFAPADDDAALVITVEPGLYSAVIDTSQGTAGVALFEIYEVP
jgi:hypothetical protein